MLPGRKAMTNLDSVLKSRGITLPTKVHLVKAMVFPVVITFLPRRKRLLISWLQSPSAVILEPPKNKVWHCFPICFPWSDGSDVMILVFWMLNFKPVFHSPLSLSSRGPLVLLHFLPECSVICISEVIDISPSNLDSSLCFLQPSVSHDVLCI